jgi:hypothetical protein
MPCVKGKKEQLYKYVPVVSPIKQPSLAEEGGQQSPDSSRTETESRKASPNRAYPMKLIIRKRTRHGALPLQNGRHLLSGKVEASNRAVEAVSAVGDADHCPFDTVETSTPETGDVKTEDGAKESNEPISCDLDLTSDVANVRHGPTGKNSSSGLRIEETAKVEESATSHHATFNDAKRTTAVHLGNGIDSEEESILSRFSKSDDDGCSSDNDINKNSTGLSQYECLRLERIKRNNDKLVGQIVALVLYKHCIDTNTLPILHLL